MIRVGGKYRWSDSPGYISQIVKIEGGYIHYVYLESPYPRMLNHTFSAKLDTSLENELILIESELITQILQAYGLE